jgi:hypothetical protein
VALAHVQPAVPRRYDVVPLVWARHLRAVRSQALRAARRLSGRALAVHGGGDGTADAASLGGLTPMAPGVRWERLLVERAPHQLCVSPWRGLVADAVATHLDASTASLHSIAR